jgi:drug/metabolite transporter (DMT)-like permease
MRHSPRVYLFLALGVLSFTLAPIFVRWASEGPGVVVAVWRTVVATVALAPFAIGRLRTEGRHLSRRDLAFIVGAGVFLGLHFVAWIESLYHTSVASASVLVTTSPIFLVGLGYVLLGEHLGRSTVVAILVAVLGAVLIGWSDAGAVMMGGKALWGNTLALLASLLVSGYLLIGRVVRQRVGWLTYVFPLYAVSAVTTLVVAGLQGAPLFGYSWTFYGWCAALALGPQLLGHGSFNYAVQFVPAALVSMLALLEPVGASLLAYVFFGEVPSLLSVVGMLTVLAAVAYVIRLRRQPSGDPSPDAARPGATRPSESVTPGGP